MTPEYIAYRKHVETCPTCDATTRKWYWTEFGLCVIGRQMLVQVNKVCPPMKF